MKLLIGIPSPRDLLEFEQAIALIPHDKIWEKYKTYAQGPYQHMRAFFLDHKEYTHFAICPDDLIVTPEEVDRLWQQMVTKDLPVLMGICNVERQDHGNPNGELAMTHNMPDGNRSFRTYEFYRKSELAGLPDPIVQVPWCGTPFAIFRRDVAEKLTLSGDMRWNPGTSCSYSFDVDIAHDLHNLGIPLLVDTSCYFYHLRTRDHMMLGIKEPAVWYDHDGIRQTIV